MQAWVDRPANCTVFDGTDYSRSMYFDPCTVCTICHMIWYRTCTVFEQIYSFRLKSISFPNFLKKSLHQMQFLPMHFFRQQVHFRGVHTLKIIRKLEKEIRIFEFYFPHFIVTFLVEKHIWHTSMCYFFQIKFANFRYKFQIFANLGGFAHPCIC